MTRRDLLAAGATVKYLNGQNLLLQLTLRTERARFRFGESVPVTWRLQNPTNQSVEIVEGHEAGPELQFDELTVTLSLNGGALALIPLMGPRSAVRVLVKTLAPGEAVEHVFDLSQAASAAGHALRAGNYRLAGTYRLRGITARTDRALELVIA